jgi:hypothetical protein
VTALNTRREDTVLPMALRLAVRPLLNHLLPRARHVFQMLWVYARRLREAHGRVEPHRWARRARGDRLEINVNGGIVRRRHHRDSIHKEAIGQGSSAAKSTIDDTVDAELQGPTTETGGSNVTHPSTDLRSRGETNPTLT